MARAAYAAWSASFPQTMHLPWELFWYIGRAEQLQLGPLLEWLAALRLAAPSEADDLLRQMFNGVQVLYAGALLRAKSISSRSWASVYLTCSETAAVQDALAPIRRRA